MQTRLSEELLRQEYEVNGKSITRIARENNLSRACVNRYFHHFGMVVLPRKQTKARDLSRCKFGKLKVVRFVGASKHLQGEWECLCDCGNTVIKIAATLLSGHTKSCGCYRSEAPKTRAKPFGLITNRMWNRIISGANHRHIEVAINPQYIEDLIKSQGFKCALSGLDITLPIPGQPRSRDKECTASLDRKDSSIGYVEGNLQWVHKTVNQMKMDMTEEDFIVFCEAIAAFQRQKICQRLVTI